MIALVLATPDFLAICLLCVCACVCVPQMILRSWASSPTNGGPSSPQCAARPSLCWSPTMYRSVLAVTVLAPRAQLLGRQACAPSVVCRQAEASAPSVVYRQAEANGQRMGCQQLGHGCTHSEQSYLVDSTGESGLQDRQCQ